ncbi:hypothetical protein HYW17_01950 [Candidatus Uhrbacteria bacterium]|nr:hypothetical protein [Candidatus Uhrbacteria bacterium]
MQHSVSTTTDTDKLRLELDEIDRLLHRLKERVGVSKTREPHIPRNYEALRKLRGLLKGKLTEDPLAYQQRIRAESDARLSH